MSQWGLWMCCWNVTQLGFATSPGQLCQYEKYEKECQLDSGTVWIELLMNSG
jgi:hypothetical protein